MDKQCTKCRETKPRSEFYRDAQKRDGLCLDCKACREIAKAKYRGANPNYAAEYRAANRERIHAYYVKWQAANADKRRAVQAKYSKDNRDKLRLAAAKWRAENRDRVRENAARWRAQNREKIRAREAEYRNKNKKKLQENKTRWYIRNMDRMKAIASEWAASRPDVIKAYAHNRRARAGSGKLSKDISSRLFKLQRGLCACCKQPLGNKYHLDHIMPLALGGTNTDDNVQLLRGQCNLRKRAKHPIDFMQERGFLL